MYKQITRLFFALMVIISLAACSESKKEAAGQNQSIGEEVDYEIIGIDPGAGIMNQADEALDIYDLDDWKITESSDSAMVAELKSAIDNKEPVIVTGWVPHWKFFEFDLKFLEDPEEAFGGEQEVHTAVRHGLKEDMPGAFTFFEQFHWEMEDMQEVMLSLEEGVEEQEAAKAWVDDNEDLVNEWIDGAASGNGTEIKIPYVAWADMIASSNVVKYVLENKLDYDVELVQVEAGPMFASIADGSTDAMVSLSLPATHAAYYEEYKDDFEDLGINLEGAENGFVVPDYVEIDSIEDLK